MAAHLGRPRSKRAAKIPRARSSTCSRCCRIRAAICTSATRATTRWATSSARFRRMRGFNVHAPDGLGRIRAARRKRRRSSAASHPADWTDTNIANMRRQFRKLGVAYDWTREIDTSSPEYYRWTQWLFLLHVPRGLAYKKEAPVNWCPVDETDLSERAGRGRRVLALRHAGRAALSSTSGSSRSTAYADRLLEGLDRLRGWPDRIKTMQRNWIGRSEGVTFSFESRAPKRSISSFHHAPRHDLRRRPSSRSRPIIRCVEQLIAGRPEETRVREFIASSPIRASSNERN